jgi:hypothetical protein
MSSDKPLTDQDLFIIGSMVASSRADTHWEDCWKTHKHCAIFRLIQEVRRQREEIQLATAGHQKPTGGES